MEVASRYTLFTSLTLFVNTVDLVDTVDMVYTVDIVDTAELFGTLIMKSLWMDGWNGWVIPPRLLCHEYSSK